MQKVRVAMMQMTVKTNCPDENLNHARMLLETLPKDRMPDFALFPETCDIGWASAEAPDLATEVPGGKVCQTWMRLAAEFGIYIVAGMTEREMARTIQRMMVERGDGEAFETIVCIGANAAECHHVPDDTVWNGRESVLVDMGVRLGGVASDLTRNLFPRPSRLYRQVYDLVLEANLAAIAAATRRNRRCFACAISWEIVRPKVCRPPPAR